MIIRVLLLAGACAAALIAAPGAAHGQQRDTAVVRQMLQQRTGRQISQTEIIERLRRSGMTRDEVRFELQRLGYDPALADPYFDTIDQERPAPRGDVRSEFLEALEEIGLMRRAVPSDSLPPTWWPDTLAWPPADTSLLDSLRLDVPADSLELRRPGRDSAPALEVFGRALFRRRAATQFEPPMLGPVDPGYRLGPGDEVNIVLTGAVQLAYNLRIGRDGTIVIPDVGQMAVAGLTLGDLQNQLYARMSGVISGVGSGADAATRIQVSLGRLRAIEVYVIGDVERPGAYQVSSLGTVFTALHRAGGPTEMGSFRTIEVRRGNVLARQVDLYDYLLHGNGGSDIRLEQGDIVFVPPAGPQVWIEGAVRRPAIYELKGGGDLRDALRFAGGPRADAALRRVQIDRIVPPAERRPGIDRVRVDVDAVALMQGTAPGDPLRDGDRVTVFEVGRERRNVVAVAGEVNRPGSYEWSPGTTLWDVLERAAGLAEGAYTARAHVFRLSPDDGTRRLLQTPLLTDSAGTPVADMVLEDRDSVVVYSRERLRTREAISIGGYVKRPGEYELAEGMTLKDLILAAGGFREGAYRDAAYVARLGETQARSDSTARALRVPLIDTGDDSGHRVPDGNRHPDWIPSAADFVLSHRDHVEIRKAPWYDAPRKVTITGEVVLPGVYVLETRQDRLTALLQKAGGLKDGAYVPGVQLERRGDPVATDLGRALEDPGSRADLLLEAGDSLHVPRYDPTVRVNGAVAYRTRILYKPGADLDYYIRGAGGYTDLADKGRVTVTYQDGARTTQRRFLLFTRSPEILPGTTIFVPVEPESKRAGFNWDSFLTKVLAVASTTATVIVAVQQVNN